MNGERGNFFITADRLESRRGNRRFGESRRAGRGGETVAVDAIDDGLGNRQLTGGSVVGYVVCVFDDVGGNNAAAIFEHNRVRSGSGGREDPNKQRNCEGMHTLSLTRRTKAMDMRV